MNNPTVANTDSARVNRIHAKALIYAIASIQGLRDEAQEWSDMRDMCAIARTIEPATLAKLVADVRAFTGTTVDIWPDHDDDLNEMERREKKVFKAVLAEHVAALEQQFAASVAKHQGRGN
jgi:hypothetical protein